MNKKPGFTLIELPVVRKRGFTLIELLIVIAIIAILATIIIISVVNARAKSQTSKAKSTLQTFKKATMIYRNETGLVPDFSATPTSRWCHPGYTDVDVGGVTSTCLGELASYISDFEMDGPYGRCAGSVDSYTLCYNYYVYDRSVMFNTALNPVDIAGPTNITDFPTATYDSCDPARTGGTIYYCDGFTF